VSQRLRTFVALDLPEVVRSELAGWCTRVAPADVRRVPAENLHLTLAFLGSRSAEEAAALAPLLAPLAHAAAVGTLSTTEALWLPPRRPGVLTVAIATGDGLARLQAALVSALVAAIAFEPERRAFRPHVTVGRVARGARVRDGALEPPPALTFHVPSMTLYRSRSVRGGARYEELASVDLFA
jgi:2'-5' RNA ligase